MEEKYMPLAQRMRPKTLEDVVGQKHLIGPKSFLRRLLETGTFSSAIIYGPPGTGKTTLGGIIANALGGKVEALSAISSGVNEAKKIIDNARHDCMLYGKPTVLLFDECHRWSKAQSDCLLSAIEEGVIIFIGLTTENPYTSMTPAIISRCKIFQLEPLSCDDIIDALNRAQNDKENGLGNLKLKVEDGVFSHFAYASAGDLRSALTSFEIAAKTSSKDADGFIVITKEDAENSTQSKALSINTDLYYDYLSAFCKSIRGSDADAALYYMQRLVLSGVQPLFIARRLIAHCSEDIGLADSNALLLATAALTSCQNLGYPECMLNLSHAVIYAALAEKSNTVMLAMRKAEDDAKNFGDLRPPYHLLNHPSTNDTQKKTYKYPHNFGGYVKQQYLPDKLKDKIYYLQGEHGKEKNLKVKKSDN